MSLDSTPIAVIHNNHRTRRVHEKNQSAVVEEVISEEEARHRREQLNRRPSYRMILKDLETVDKQLKKESAIQPMIGNLLQNQSPASMTATQHGAISMNQVRTSLVPEQQQSLSVSSRIDHTTSYIQPAVLSPNLHNNGDNGLNTLPNAHHIGAEDIVGQYSPVSGSAVVANISAPGAGGVVPRNEQRAVSKNTQEIVRSVHSNDAVGAPTIDWQSNIMSGYNSSPSPILIACGSRDGRSDGSDDNTRKRQVRLLKNREAAKECRRKKKEYVKCLENRVTVLENQNKALIEELKTLKELYCRKEKVDL